MTDQLGGAAHRVKVTLDWKVNGHAITSPDRLSDVMNHPARRRAEATKKIKAHVKEHVGPKASFKFANKQELIMGQISASMGRDAFEDAVDSIPDLKYTMAKEPDTKVEVSFGDVTSGGRRRGKTRRNRKARSTRRR